MHGIRNYFSVGNRGSKAPPRNVQSDSPQDNADREPRIGTHRVLENSYNYMKAYTIQQPCMDADVKNSHAG